MEAFSRRNHEEQQKQAELRRQIALLQAQLKDVPDEQAPAASVQVTPKKRKLQGQTLAPGTPSPKKQKAKDTTDRASTRFSAKVQAPARPQPSSSRVQPLVSVPAAAPSKSTVLSKLAGMGSKQEEPESNVLRSTGFSESAPTPLAPARDENLTLIEDLEPGPYDHKAPFDDPHFQKLEPHSGIRLSSRTILHEDFSDYLRGRYYLSPSRLYSVIRLLPNKQGYDVPVEGDWVTIAVVAERGPMKYSKAPVGIGKGDAEGLPEDDSKTLSLDAPTKPAPIYNNRWKSKAKDDASSKPSGKRYVNLRLVDFGCRTKTSATGEKAIIRGDAFLSLLLFESDSVEEITREDGTKQKLYKGGSRGAFERMAKLKEGSVIALLNPKILKPFQQANSTPHPTDNILALTPESIDSVAVIGHAQDLGMCTVTKRDGKACGGWCDKRISDVCEYHIHHAVQRARAGRSEFATGTSGMSTGAKRKPAYDPARQWGLKPETEHAVGSATYVVSGHIVSGGADTKSMFMTENFGRDAQAKAARKASSKAADATLQTLLKRDKEGMKAVTAAREFEKKMAEKAEKEKVDKKGKTKTRTSGKEKEKEKEREPLTEDGNSDAAHKSSYSVNLIRSLGFDPTGKDGRKAANKEVQKKLEVLASVQASRKDITLGPRPGKLKSTVRAPDKPAAGNPPKTTSEPDSETNCASASASDSDPLAFRDDSDGEIDKEIEAFGRPATKMISLDSSDVELEVEPPL